MEEKDGHMSATFATMKGHIEKGKITFRLFDDSEGKMRFPISSMSKVDMGLAPEKYSREQQKKSCSEALNNVVKLLGGKETKREVEVAEPAKIEEKK